MSNSFVSLSTLEDLNIRVRPTNGDSTLMTVRFLPGVSVYLTVEDAETLRDQLAVTIAQMREAVGEK